MSDVPKELAEAVVGRYRIERQIGAGGMATVYLAVDLRHHREVAIKVLKPEIASALGAERFLTEIRTTANLRHPHILPLFDSGQAGALLFFVMPYVEGESLRARIAREELTLDETVAIVRDVAAALDHAHSRGVIHRDVKPGNILVGEGGALVADFGIALAVHEAGGGRLTRTGMSLGTPGYMSFEQASGEEATEASDVYALACVAYEMLAGRPPFTGPSAQAVFAKVLTEPAPPIRSVRPSLSAEIEDVLARGLAREPAERFPTAGDLARSLEAVIAGVPARKPRGRLFAVAAGVVALALAVAGLRFYGQLSDERWVRETAIPEIERRMASGDLVEAFDLIQEAGAIVPDDPTIGRFLDAASVSLSGDTDPSGARVFARGYSSPDTAWRFIGRTPLEQVLVPDDYLRFRVEADGHAPLELAAMPVLGLSATLVPDTAPYQDMVWVPAGVWSYTTREPIPVERFLIDRYEVTNAEYRRFIDQGGYRTREHWTEPFMLGGEVLDWEEGIALLEDRTGRPGPATWELSEHPEGREAFPVSGVSWYEAAAYCTSRGKSLPTFYHWRQAAGLEIFDDILAFSNFSGEGAVAVGSGGGVGPFGTLDQAGNVKEWVWNASRGGLRQILGGAWNEPKYQFQDPDARDPFTREETHGFRCARYVDPPDPALLASNELPFFDFNDVEPVDDATFETLGRFFDYDRGPLNARLESVDSLAGHHRERVSFEAAYGGERVEAYVVLPPDGSPPYQTVVYFPGADAFLLDSSENLAEWHLLSFIPRSGRALVFPIYKGTYERTYERQAGTIAMRQHTVWVTQDLRRTVDYIVERADLDQEKLGYMGLSLGGEWGIPLAMEPRFGAAVLVGGAFDAQWLAGAGTLPETSPWNFTPRIRMPTVLINGRYDFQHPYETGQVPFFRSLGAPDEHKKFVLLETGHVPPWNDVIRETLDWLDRYLGSVDQG